MKEQPAVVRYVRLMKKCFVILSCIVIPAIMVCAVFAFAGYIGFWIVTPAVLIVYLAVYAWYALHVSIGTVIGLEVTSEVIHVKTKRGTYTYDVKTGCAGVRRKKHRLIATFRTQTSQDSFTFYLRAPFSKPYEEAFTERDLVPFWNGEESEEM